MKKATSRLWTPPQTTLTPSSSRIPSPARISPPQSRQHLITPTKQIKLMLKHLTSPESFLRQMNPPYRWARVTLWSRQRSPPSRQWGTAHPPARWRDGRRPAGSSPMATDQRFSWGPPIAGCARQRDGSRAEPIH